MTNYSETKEINEILQKVETDLTELVGRLQAQRFIGLFSAYITIHNPTATRNIWQEIYDAGRNSK
jgi:hypothetical protein